MMEKGQKVGVLKVRQFRPWGAEKFIKAIPATCKKIAVLDRMKENGAFGEPLFTDVCATLHQVRETYHEEMRALFCLWMSGFIQVSCAILTLLDLTNFLSGWCPRR
jgi:pyruvate/2-oxoacid:ferredoxin oxidoreductase alpha subunit